MIISKSTERNIILVFYPDYDGETDLLNEIKEIADTLGIISYTSAPMLSFNKKHPVLVNMILSRKDISNTHAHNEFVRYIENTETKNLEKLNTKVFYFKDEFVNDVKEWLKNNDTPYKTTFGKYVEPDTFQEIAVHRFELENQNDAIHFKMRWL